MEHTGESQIENDIDDESLFLASVIFMDVNRTISGIQILVAAMLAYMTKSTSIADGLIRLGEQITSGQAGKHSDQFQKSIKVKS